MLHILIIVHAFTHTHTHEIFIFYIELLLLTLNRPKAPRKGVQKREGFASYDREKSFNIVATLLVVHNIRVDRRQIHPEDVTPIPGCAAEGVKEHMCFVCV